MYKKREMAEGAFYHVTSRTNNKIRVFENKLGRKIMLMVLQDAKEKFQFRLANFCIMPTHIHLLIEPAEGTSLSMIMQWIKQKSAKRWNFIHGSKDHMWGRRYFARIIKDQEEFEYVMGYIDQNPVTAGLVVEPYEWSASGTFYRKQNLQGLVDLPVLENQPFINQAIFMPPAVSKFLPPAQLEHVIKYLGAYIESIEALNEKIMKIPKLADGAMQEINVYLRFFTGTADYFICGYDGDDLLYGKIHRKAYPSEAEYCTFSLSSLKINQFMELDFSW